MVQAGLTQKEAERRLSKYGLNEIARKKQVSDWLIILDQIKSPLIYVLIGAMVITGWFLKDMQDTVVIGVAVAFNTILGFLQERKASRAMAALAEVLSLKAWVKRNGEWVEVEAKTVVPGDLVKLSLGIRIPGDGQIVNAESLSINEAVLTGESAAADKKIKDKVFMGTMVVSGTGEMLVETTGGGTEFGKIAASLGETKEQATPLQQQIDRLAKTLTRIVVIVCLLVVGIGWLTGMGLGEIFPTAVALAVASIPEGLAVSLTVILAIGMQRILKKKALVRKLVAAETLGGVSVIALDKTGTLTEGKMKVVRAITEDETMLRKAAVLCNDMRDPLETAMMEWGREKYSGDEKRLKTRPFNHEDKMISTLYENLLLVSGAPEVVLKKCSMTNFQFSNKIKEFEKEAKKGYRLVGFGYKKTNKIEAENLVWLGVIIYDDPIRIGVSEALRQARQAGIRIKMITGDYWATAEAVGKKLGFNKEDIYSRIRPEEKLKIVAELQEAGEVVAMTGDGVNDAPALKKADVGIVVNEASDVAKETADMVLMDNNFATILMAVAEGRLIRANLKKVIIYLLSDSFEEILIIILSLLAGVPLAITAGMILWINLISDGLPSIALTVEPAETDLLKRGPDKRQNWLIDTQVSVLIGLISITSAVAVFAIFLYYWHQPGYGLEHARSVAFTLLGLNSLAYVWSARSLGQPMWQVKWWQNRWLIIGVLLGLGLQLIGLYSDFGQRFLGTVGLRWSEWLVVGLGCMMTIFIVEGVKWAYNKKT